ncbi:MAG: hypothetical protein JW895_05740 [Thermoleophilaceae bacterium]|nr:hypothetical protein [Thermoleophilaceae bacterium]
MRKTKLTTGLLIAAAALPVAAQAATPPYHTDLRSPDARDAAANPQYVNEARHYTDLRSPDARDAALASARNEPNRVPPVARVATASDGFDWGDSAIGATAMLGLLAVGTGAFVVLGGQRHRRTVTPS